MKRLDVLENPTLTACPTEGLELQLLLHAKEILIWFGEIHA